MDDGWHIGELAQRSGATAKTIRYYEALGLLPPARRSLSGYRLYGPRDLERLAFIRKAQRLGLSLGEIRQILGLCAQGIAPCERVVDLLDRQLAALDERIRELQVFRGALAALRDAAATRRPRGAICGIIESQPLAELPPALAHGGWQRPQRAGSDPAGGR